MIILVTNDDGIFAEGMRTLVQELAKEQAGEIYAVAPDRERSATGHAITLDRPIHVQEVTLFDSKIKAWSVTGTPADCVKLGIMALLEKPPDIVISGINKGPNLATDVFYSGTVSAAIEGAILGVPSVAVSLSATDSPDYTLSAKFTIKLIRAIQRHGLPPNTLLNVNLPALDESQIVGVAVTQLGVRKYVDVFHKRIDPRGRVYYWLAGTAMDEGVSPDTDVGAIRNNYISVTPLSIDMTRPDLIKTISAWNLEL